MRNKNYYEVNLNELHKALSGFGNRPTLLRRIVRTSILSLVVVSLFGVVAAIGWVKELRLFEAHDEILSVITSHRPSDNSVVFDKEGEKIGEFFNRYHLFVPYEKLPKFLIQSIVATEDRNFFIHPGIDVKGILRAAVAVVKGGQYSQGASTITQQLVRNFLLTREKTLHRKAKEIALSLQLERKLSKKKIIEIYCNSMFLGNGAYGVGAAAHRYFGKKIGELKNHELALLAGLFQSPSRYNPKRNPTAAKTRQKTVIRSLYHEHVISRRTALNLIKRPLVYSDYTPLNQTIAPYFVSYVRSRVPELIGHDGLENRGLRIFTTLDRKLQEKANETFIEKEEHFNWIDTQIVQKRWIKDAPPPRSEAAMLSIDPKLGEILTMNGGRDYEASQFNRAAGSLRSPGSGFKPVIYSLGLDQGKTWADLAFVSPIAVNGYRPKNYKDQYLTETTLIRAFYLSLNTTAVEVGSELGINNIIEHATNLGVKSTLKAEPGTILGSSEVTMLDMGRVYSTFANNGTLVDPIAILRIESRSGKVLYEAPKIEERSRAVLTPQVNYLMIDAMRHVFSRGTATRGRQFASIAAGKTGTSNESQDNWFFGITPELVTLVWAGTDDHSTMTRATTGSSAALPVWITFMEKALADGQGIPFQKPSGVRTVRIDPKFGNRSSKGILVNFISGTEPGKRKSDLENVSITGRHRAIFAH